MSDDLEATIGAAIDKASAPESPPPAQEGTPAGEGVPSAPPSEGKAPAGERQRDDTGRFVAKEPAEPVAAEKKNEASGKTATGAQAQAPQAEVPQNTPAVTPPAHWKGNGKVDWARLPANVQKAIREDYAQLDNVNGELQRLKSAIGDRAQVLAASYGSVENGLQYLFALSDFATKNPLGFVQWFTQQRGIDLNQLVQGAMQGQQPAGEPHPSDQRIAQLEGAIRNLLQQQQQQQLAPLQAQIDSFAQDQSHPYFNDVRTEMAALMQAGRARSLQEAYDMAVWANPEVRQSLLDKQIEEARKADAAKVAQAKQATGSIAGSPAGARTPRVEPNLDLEATIRAAAEAAGIA